MRFIYQENQPNVRFFKFDLSDFITKISSFNWDNIVSTALKSTSSKKQLVKIFNDYLINQVSFYEIFKNISWENLPNINLKNVKNAKKPETVPEKNQNQLPGFIQQEIEKSINAILGSLYKNAREQSVNTKNPYKVKRVKSQFGQCNMFQQENSNQLTLIAFTDDSNQQKIDPIPLYKAEIPKKDATANLVEQVINQLIKLVNDKSRTKLYDTQQVRDMLITEVIKRIMKYNNLTQAYENDINNNVHQGQTFIQQGDQYTWVQSFQQYSVQLNTGQHWVIWSAKNNNGDLMYFVVDQQTSFIDWGPCQTLQECAEFLDSKQFDSDQDEGYFEFQESLSKNLKQENNTNTNSTTQIRNNIITAINDQWKTIQYYNNLMQQLQTNGYEQLSQVVQDVTAEEINHVGMLQQILNKLQNVKQTISGGQDEAVKIMKGEQKPK